MRNGVMAVAALVLSATAVQAGDGYGPAAYNWSGLYLGVHAGGGWGEHEGVGTYTDPGYAPCATGCAVLDPGVNSIDLDGYLGGGQIGFNIQSGSLVFGLEADGSWANIEGDGSFASDDDNDGTADYTWNLKTDVEWIATVRGRLGVLVTPTLLLYGTGGIAWAGVSSDEQVICHAEQCLAGDNPTTVLASSSETARGWVAGAGAEWGFAPSWTLKAEWQHIQIDDVDTKFSGTAYPDNNPVPAISGYSNDSFPGDITIDTIKLGVNYKF